jgi:L-rhamnose-H+ transport protein
MIGVMFHWLGGLAAGSFYAPYRFVRKWAWETYWLVGGFFAWILAPLVFALIMTPDLFAILRDSPGRTLFWAYFFGVLWGIGGLAYGLTMRYLGISLGCAVALGFCAAFGTLMPPIFSGEFVGKVLGTSSGQVVLVGVAVCLAGIAIAGLAGMVKEQEMTTEQKQLSIVEFSFWKGLFLAIFAGVMSACFAYGLTAGDPIKAVALDHGTGILWQGLPALVVVLWGGFTTNVLWCVSLNIRNRTAYQYLTVHQRPPSPSRLEEPILETAIDAPSEEVFEQAPMRKEDEKKVSLLVNYCLCAVAGVTWYFQFFFYSMGETQMGRFKFSSWTLHMASIIIFSTLWGIGLREWKGTSRRARIFLTLGLLTLILSTVVVGYGNYLAIPR